MPRAYSYTRFSTPEQAQGDSARRQIDLAKRYAAKHGLELDESLRLSDDGVSGFRGANVRKGALGHFLSAIYAGEVAEGSYLLVESLDRVSRQNPWDALPIFQQIINAGVILVTLFDEKRYEAEEIRKNPFRIMESLFVMVRAHEESETKSRRLRAVWTAKRARASDTPLTKLVPAWLTTEGSKIVPHPERAEVIRRIVTMFRQGIGQHRIAETLNREGVKVFGSGKMWHRSYIRKVLGNPALVGTFVPHEMEYEGGKRTRKALQPVEGYFPAVISQDEWSDVTALLLSEGRQPQHRAQGIKNILAGLAECPLCGAAMTRVMKGSGLKGGRPKLVCTKAKLGAGCEYRTVDLPEVERVIREGVERVLEDAPSGNTAIDQEVQALAHAVESSSNAITVLIDEMIEHGRSPALSAALADLEAKKATGEAALSESVARQAVASGASQERRRRELVGALGAPVDVLNAKLRGVFARILPDYRDGRLYFRWFDGSTSATALIFAWVG